MPTRNGVFRQDLASSPWTCDVSASGRRIRFFFSTYRHYMRFEELWRSAAASLTNTVRSRTGFEVDMTLPAAVKLYTKLETYGFYIVMDGEPVWRAENLAFDGPRPRTRACEAPSSPSIPPSPMPGG